jgi:hypothetical protein
MEVVCMRALLVGAVVILVLASSSTGMAQEVESAGDLAPARTSPWPPGGYDDSANIPGELIGGVLGYTLGLGGALGVVLAFASGGLETLLVGIPTAIFVAGAGLAGGITIGGNTGDAEGRFWAAFGGQAIGGLLSFAWMMSHTGDRDGPFTATNLAAMVVLPLLGGILGYELSDGPDGPAITF